MSSFTCEKAENCFANAQTYSYTLPVRLDEKILFKFEEKGELTLKKNFRRPFFFWVYNQIQVKGIIHDDRMKVSYPDGVVDELKTEFEVLIEEILGGTS